MDKLVKAAEAFQNLTDYEYRFVIGRKGKAKEFKLVFMTSDFHHLAGLQKMKDITQLKTGDRAKIFRDILEGQYTHEFVCKSRYASFYKERVDYLIDLEQILDNQQMIYDYHKKKCVFYTTVKGHYLFKYCVQDKTVFIFTYTEAGNQHLRTLFPKTQNKDFSLGQTAWTLLLKEKMHIASKEKVERYRNPAYKP